MPIVFRFVLIVGSSVAYLGLAVLGWGGFAAFFCRPAFIALSVVLFALSGAALFADGNLSPGEREDRGNRWVIAAFAVIGLLDGYLPAYTDRYEFWTIDGHDFAGSASSSSLAAARCGSGRSLCSAAGSAGWWRSSPGTPWSR